MKTRRFSTKYERYEIVKRFLSSGQSKVSWCKENDITSATLYRWIKEYNSTQDDVTFLSLQPIKSKVNRQQVKSDFIGPSNDILIELGHCKIHVPEHIGLSFIMQMMKEAEGSNV